MAMPCARRRNRSGAAEPRLTAARQGMMGRNAPALPEAAPRRSPMTDISAETLLQTETVTIRDVACGGACRHKSAEECAAATHLVFPYRGVFVRHLGSDDAVGEANQVVFFNPDEA